MTEIKTKEFKLNIDSASYRKKPIGKDIASISNRLSSCTVTATPAQIADLVGNQGKSMLPAIMNGGRKNENFVEQSVYAIDFDNDTYKVDGAGKKVKDENGRFIKVKAEGEKYNSLAEILENNFIKEHGCFAYKTFSHTDEWERFRVVFFLNKPLKNTNEVALFYQYLASKLPNIDPATKDPARLFYGGTEAIEIDFSNVVDTDEALNELKSNPQESFSFTVKPKQKKQQNVTPQRPPENFDDLVQRYIEADSINLESPENWVSVLYSLMNSYYAGELTQGQCEKYCGMVAMGNTQWAYKNVERFQQGIERGETPDTNWTFVNKVNAVLKTPKKPAPKNKPGNKNIDELAEETMYCSWDDSGNAERFKIVFGDDFLYNTTAQEWYMYNEKVWQPDEMLMSETCATAITDVMKREPINAPPKEVEKIKEAKDRFIKETRNHNKKMNMLKSARSLLPITGESFDRAGNVINLQNGYFDLNKNEFKEHDSKKLFTLISNASYTPDATSPLWEKFIEDSFLGDAELIEYVQRAVGYSISNSTAERLMFFLFGQETGTGKSVFTNVLNELLGSYSQNIKPEALMIDRNKTGDSADPSIAKLKGARLVTTSESSEAGKIDESLIKRITGGDRITARFLHKNEITYTPEFKIWMATNYKPIVQNNDSAIWERLVVIPMDNVVPASEADMNLTDKLKAEIDGILNWAIEGYYKYLDHGLRKSEPEAIKEQRKSYHEENDTVGSFIEECCILDSQASVKSSDIWNAYKIWCEGNGEHAGSQRKLSIELGKRFDRESRRDGNYFLGLDFIK